MASEEEMLAAVQSRAASLRGASGSAALSSALKDPPIASKVNETKDANAQVVAGVLSNISDNDIQKSVDALTMDELDVLMKYIYKLLGDPSNTEKNGSLLKWHEKCIAKTGLGSVVRSMTDRKTV
jgi:actin related protein 2/3 complex subunit 5